MNAPDGVSIAAYTGSQAIWKRTKFSHMGDVADMLHAARLVTDGDDRAWFAYLYDTARAMRGTMEVAA